MDKFIQRFSDQVIGTLNGYDRLLIHGNIRRLCYAIGMKDYLWEKGILLKDFGDFAEKVTKEVNDSVRNYADRKKRPLLHLESLKINKESVALQIAHEDKISQGLIAILSCVESCRSYKVEASRERKEINLKMTERKCKHFYHYMFHPEFGFMYARFQTWFPFKIEIYLNGREWLSRQMDRCGMKYRRLDNCFSWIDDFSKAQNLMNKQLKIDWPKKLAAIARELNPRHEKIFESYPIKYYWSIAQSEWATDIVFKDRKALAAIYPSLILHGITNFGSQDVMRFLSKKLNGHFEGEVTSDFKVRSEGVRIKHRVGTNSIKLYDKFGLVLRNETTINDARMLKTFRPLENKPDQSPVRTYLRVGIADIVRRSEICQRANEKYLDALAVVETNSTLSVLLEKISKRVLYNANIVRGLRPWEQTDLQLIKAISRGEFALNGFRNRDIQQILFKMPANTLKEKRSRSSKITRLLRILRAHGVIKKIPRSYRYTLTAFGRDLTNAILSTQTLTLKKLQEATAA
jgi:hypothetical protein